MSWNIVYTVRARYDLRDRHEYIAYELLVPETAAALCFICRMKPKTQ